jgi:membrane protease YdiL (CAAX protease family)
VSRPPVTTARAVRALVRLGMRRMVNRLSSRRRRGGPADKRTATAGKRRRSPLVVLLMGVIFLFLGGQMGARLIDHLASAVGATERDGTMVLPLDAMEDVRTLARRTHDEDAERDRARERLARRRAETAGRAAPDAADRQEIDRWAERYRADPSSFETAIGAELRAWRLDAAGRADRVAGALGILVTILFAGLLAQSLAGEGWHLGEVGWTLEWLFGFPVRSRSLFLAVVLQRAAVNGVGWIVFLSLWGCLFVAVGAGWAVLALAPVAALASNLGLAAAHVALETALRRSLSPARLRNVQAVAVAVGALFFLAPLVAAYHEGAGRWLVAHAAGWTTYLPWSLALGSAATDRVDVVSLALHAGAAVAMVAGAVVAAERMVAGGLVIAGAQSGRRGDWSPPAGRRARGIAGRELRLLARDRALMVQTLVIPLVVIGFQIVINPRLWTGAVGSPAAAAALAFGVGAWVMIQSGLLLLATEGEALWLLYTLPQPLGRLLGGKVALWAAIGLAYALAVVTAVVVASRSLSLALLIDAALAMLGVALVTVVAAAIGILRADPRVKSGRRVQPEAFWSALSLASLYGFTFFAEPWPRIVITVLMALTALALWQRAADELPYLLDPTELPAPALVVSDGIVALLVFAVLQALIGAVLARVLAPWAVLLVAFTAAGALVLVGALRALRRRGVRDLARALGWRAASSRLRAIGVGAALGAASGLVAVAYLIFLSGRAVALPGAAPDRAVLITFLVLAVAVAPFVEELVFRGILYGALRRSLSPAVAIAASAALFAIVHPPLGAPAVFLLGIAAAIARERTGRIAAAVAAHTAYNAIIAVATLLGG